MTADADAATDTDLWDRLRGGDREALGVLFDRHGNAVYDHEGQNATRSLRRVAHRDRRAGVAALADHADDVAARIDDERRMAEVRRAMAIIPAHQRITIELVLWAGLSPPFGVGRDPFRTR